MAGGTVRFEQPEHVLEVVIAGRVTCLSPVMCSHHHIDISSSIHYHHYMRTTLTLDDDVAALLKRIAAKEKGTFKQLVNQALRRGLATHADQPRRAPFRTTGFDLGPSLVGSLDNVEEVLARVEGEDHR